MGLIQSTEPTGSTALAEVINSEFIHRRMQTIPVDPYVGLMIAGLIATSDGATNSNNYELKAPNQFTGAATVAENDRAPEESLVPTSVGISGLKKGLSAFVLDRPARLAVFNAGVEVIKGLTHAQADHLHLAIMALLTSISATSGDASTNNDLANWDLVTGLFRAANHDMGPLWAAMKPIAVRQLRANLRSSATALYGSAFGEASARALMNTQPGMGVNFDGFTLWESNDCPVGDTTGWTNAIGVGSPDMQENAGIVRVRWEQLSMEMQRDAQRYGTWLVSGTTWGVGIAKQSNLRKFITSGT